jgi:hypothetical protein
MRPKEIFAPVAVSNVTGRLHDCILWVLYHFNGNPPYRKTHGDQSDIGLTGKVGGGNGKRTGGPCPLFGP